MFKKFFIFSVTALFVSIYFAKTKYFLYLYNLLLVNVESSVNTSMNSEKLFSQEELKHYNGIDKPLLYLAILGNVFDVTKGEQHYGPQQPYNFFVGHDASKNFITGKFTPEDLSEEVTGLAPQELLSLNNWLKFYDTEYARVGKLVGKYYDKNGEPTAYGMEVSKLIKTAQEIKETEKLLERKFPPCNVEWDPVQGSRVWCTSRSGGIERSWIGKPRQFYEPGSHSFRCACILTDTETQNSGNIKEYDGCDRNSESCFVKDVS